MSGFSTSRPENQVVDPEEYGRFKIWQSMRSVTPAGTPTVAVASLKPYIPNPDSSTTSGVSWGLIIPIILIGIFLLAVATCLYWHNWRDKRRLQGESTVPNLSLSTFSRTFQTGNQWTKDLRSSTRSTTPLRASVRDKATVHPIEFKQSDCLSDSLASSQSSWSRSTGNNSSIQREGPARYFQRRNLSPIDEMEPYVSKFLGSSNIASVSQYEGCTSSQNMFSPYHLTWVSPQVRGPHMPAEDLNNNYTASESSFYQGAKGSPYFPNNNTPTTECERVSGQQSPNKIINSLPTSVPTSYNPTPATSYPSSERSSESSLTDPSGSTAVGVGSSIGYPGTSYAPGSSRGPSEAQSLAASDSSSLPSSINPFRQSNLARMSEPVRSNQARPLSYESTLLQQSSLNQPLASSIDSYTSSDNTSLYPNIGSSVNTSSHPLSLPSNPMSVGFGPSGYNTPNDGHGDSSTPSNVTRSDEVFDSAVSIQDGETRTCLIHGETSSIGINGSTSIATALFRSWSANAQLDYSHSAPVSRVASPISAPPVPYVPSPANHFPHSRNPEGADSAANHNNLNKPHAQSGDRYVVFQNIPPMLEAKKYWL